MQQDLASLHAKNWLLRTPAVPQVVCAPRQVAFTTTKVPQFHGTTSWEQYRQVFDTIVRSNGWDNDTEALVPVIRIAFWRNGRRLVDKMFLDLFGMESRPL